MEIKVSITGVSPIICNRFTDAAAAKATVGSGVVTQHGKQDSPHDQCVTKLYMHDGVACIPSANLLSCITAAGTFFKMGKSKVTTMKTSIIPACVSIGDGMVPIKSKDGWSVDDRAVRNPATGGRFLCYRPRFDVWALSFAIELDETMLSDKLLREIVDVAGKRIGLGDYRPSCKGPFGRFSVDRWEVQKALRVA